MKKSDEKSFMKEHKGQLKVLGVVLGILAILLLAAYGGNRAGVQVGNQTGMISGTAVGSFLGFQDGLASYEEGKEDGLEAKDTLVQMDSGMRELGKLEVLVAGANLINHNMIGESYQALYSIPGTAVFSVDMQQMETSEPEAGQLQILLPIPEMEFYRNEEKVEKLAEYQKNTWSGGAEEGYDAYINSQKELTGKVEEMLSNYDTMVELARDSAIRQVTMLAKAVAPEGTQVSVDFMQ